jgi:hypothetical protein
MSHVLITGASSGIGLEFSKVFAKHGHNLVLVARSQETLITLKDHIEKSFGVDVKIIIKDLADPYSPKEIYDDVHKSGIKVNILVNNAGFGTYGKFVEQDLIVEHEMIQVNVDALTQLTKLFLKDMLEEKHGKILNVASTAAFQPGPFMAVYYATKAYVLSFSEALAEELRGTGITVTTLCPGPTKTNFQKEAKIDGGKLFGKNIPTGKELAEYGYEAMVQGKRVTVYGFRNKVLAQASRFAPRKIITRMVRKIHGE